MDVSLESGIRTASSKRVYRASYGPLWLDLNDDQALDLIFMNHGHPPGVWLNQSDGTFDNTFATSGLRYGEPAYYHQWDRHGCACADYDNDGDVDLFIAHGGAIGRTLGVKSDELLRHDHARHTFEDVTQLAGTRNANGRARFPTWADVDNDGWLDLYIGNAGTANVLYHSNGDGTFSDVTAASGLGLIRQNRHAWTDLDLDGDLDLVALSPLKLLRNDGAAGFKAVKAARSGLRGGGKSITVGDFNRDGLSDIFVTAVAPARNRMYLSDGQRFELVDDDLGPSEGSVCKGAEWGDLDNDGAPELVVGCSDGLYLARLDPDGSDTGPTWSRLSLETDLSFESDVDIALGDYQGDGLLDIAVICSDGNHLLSNRSAAGGAWIALDLRGSKSNRMGFGAKISVELADGRSLFREHLGDSGFYGSVSCGPVHLGLGKATEVDIEITWPSGAAQRLEQVRTNQIIEVEEPG